MHLVKRGVPSTITVSVDAGIAAAVGAERFRLALVFASPAWKCSGQKGVKPIAYATLTDVQGS